MKKQFLVFLFFCQFAFVRAQEEAFAVINDKDGYVNVREGKSAQSKVLKKLNNKTIVFVYNYDKATDGNWIYTDEEGYIYNDRVKWIFQVKNGEEKITISELKELQTLMNAFVFDVLGLRSEEQTAGNNDKLDGVLQLLINMRMEARANKDFALSDKIRDELLALGIQLKDGKEGTSYSLN